MRANGDFEGLEYYACFTFDLIVLAFFVSFHPSFRLLGDIFANLWSCIVYSQKSNSAPGVYLNGRKAFLPPRACVGAVMIYHFTHRRESLLELYVSVWWSGQTRLSSKVFEYAYKVIC
jgi:hypothetical protein